MHYQVVLFDADGTLFDFHRAEREAIRAAFEAYHLEFSADLHGAAYTRVNAQIWKEFEQGLISGGTLARERFRRLFDELESSSALSMPAASIDPSAFAESYLSFLGRGAYPLPGAEALVTALAGAARLAIITNGFAQVQRSRFSRTPFMRHFDAVFISSEIGSQKPDPAFFQPVLERYRDVEKQSMLIVGDSLTSDIRGGMNVGIETCWYNPAHSSAADGIVPTYTVAALADVEGIVRNTR